LQVVTPVNDAPVLANNTTVSLTVIEEDATNPSGTLVSDLLGGMSDVDAGAVKGIAAFDFGTNFGTWQFSLDSGNNWTAFGSVSATTARLLNGATLIRYVPAANVPDQVLFKFYAWDLTSGSVGGTADLGLPTTRGGTTAFSNFFVSATQDVLAINDAPVITSPNTVAPIVNTPLVFSTANGNAITVSDVDVDVFFGKLSVDIGVINGRFTLSTLTGITVSFGNNGTSSFLIEGTPAAINAALAGSTLTPNDDYLGAGTLTLVLSDNGNFGSGGTLSSTKEIAFSLQAPPVATSLGPLSPSRPTSFVNGSLTAGVTASRFYSFSIDATTDVRLVLSGLTSNANLQLFRPGGQLVQ